MDSQVTIVKAVGSGRDQRRPAAGTMGPLALGATVRDFKVKGRD